MALANQHTVQVRVFKRWWFRAAFAVVVLLARCGFEYHDLIHWLARRGVRLEVAR